MPVNWSAYEDIAEFFSVHVQTIDGERVYGHMDYGKKDPSLGWRFTDAWLSMAGAGDAGIPNGLPVDEWGIRVEGLPAGGRLGRPRWRGERTGGGLCPEKVHGVAESLCTTGSLGDDVFRGRTGTRAGPHRPADLLVHDIHGRHDRAGICRW